MSEKAARRGPSKRHATGIAAAIVGLEAALLRRRSGRGGGRVIVRCSQGHLFSTIWIPGASLKAVRLGGARFQRCPVGRHWSLVRPVRPETLTPEERAQAQATRDTRIP